MEGIHSVFEGLERQFQEAEQSTNVSDHLKFKSEVLAATEPSGVEFHYELIRRSRNPGLQDVLSRFFAWRGDTAVKFLLPRLETETDPGMLATALQILGAMKRKEALPKARQLIRHPEAVVRQRACIVLGWIGDSQDISTLGRLQIDETDTETRKWAATQQMHIWLRCPETKARILENLMSAVRNETDPRVQYMIVWTASKILKRTFGLKGESDTPPEVLANAVRRASVALTNSVEGGGKK